MKFSHYAARLALAVTLLGVAPGSAFAEEAASVAEVDFDAIDEERAKRMKRLPVTDRTEKRINIALEALEEEDYEEAGFQLKKLSFLRMNAHERALVARLLAQVAFSNGDPAGAIGYFRKAIEQEALPIEDENSLRFNIAQIQISESQWKPALATIEEWFRFARDPNPLGYYLSAIAHYNLEEFEEAIVQARKAVELSDEPRESWLQLLVALYAMKEDFANARPVLEELVTRFPKKQYWVQLSLIYGAADDFHESLSVQQLAYAQGLLVEDRELQRLARSYLYHEMPYQAAQVIERGLEDGAIEEAPESLELLGNSWISAREYERALPPIRRAAELSEGGALYVRLGQVLVQREAWPEAIAELRKGLEKGGLEDEGKAKLLLAISLYSNGEVDEARTWFARAAGHESTAQQGKAWIGHIDRELAEQAASEEIQTGG